MLELLHSERVDLLLAHDLLKNGTGALSAEAEAGLLTTLEDMLTTARTRFGISGSVAAATAVFRKASNGMAILDKLQQQLGLRVHLLEQAVEGAVGFRTAATAWAADAGADPAAAAAQVVAWDSGGGSFQLTIQEGPPITFTVWEGPLGSASMTAMMVEKVQGRSFAETQSANPATAEQAAALQALTRRTLEELHQPMPPALAAMLASSEYTVVGIGQRTCVFALGSQVTGKSVYTLADVRAAIGQTLERSDEELGRLYLQPEMVVPKLCLLIVVMDMFRIPAVSYKCTNGSCIGLLVTPSLWNLDGDDK